jgi:hypothetical protein
MEWACLMICLARNTPSLNFQLVAKGNVGACPMWQSAAEDIRHLLFTSRKKKTLVIHLRKSKDSLDGPGVWEQIESMLLIHRSGSIFL